MSTPSDSSRIHVLDPATINQIAAGEVVERPASVVKELAENAIDAGGGIIRIELTSSPDAITRIRVIDDGSGMSPADARLAFASHATSKIRALSDLHRIRTLGFRGEALATIAAVSRTTLITKCRGSATFPAVRIVIEGGVIREEGGTGAPEGTSVLVEDLFFNTPARKKFQKSRNTELVHIHETIEALSLARPDTAFHLYHNGAPQLITDRTQNLTDTVARIFGSDLADGLVPVRASLPLLAIDGYIARPAFSRKDSARIFISVNRRPVRAPVVRDAIRAGYGTLLPRDRFPVAFLDLAIDPALVDVNVHPTKRQIRFSREQEIAGAVSRAVRESLLARDLIPSAGSPHATRPRNGSTTQPDDSYVRLPIPEPSGVSEATHAGTLATDQRLRQTELATGAGPAVPVPPLLPEIEVIGEFSGIYILAMTVNDELLLIDQHAAHERILYEQVGGQTLESRPFQELISPVVLHRTAREAALVRDLLPALEKEGFVIGEFGGDSFLVSAVPVVLGRLEDPAVIDEILSDLTSGEGAQAITSRERITRVVACRGAVKAGTVCTREQCQRIVDQLRRTKNPFTCPHGRPTMIRFTRRELDAMFRRT